MFRIRGNSTKELAKDFKIAYRSNNPQKEFPYSPSILVLENGRYVMSIDVSDLYGKVYISDDKGENWELKADTEYYHASLFKDGNRIYVLGAKGGLDERRGDLVIMYSDDFGDTWSEISYLTNDSIWSPANNKEKWMHTATDVWYKDGYVYVPMDCFL